METQSHKANGAVGSELKKEGYFKMQIGGFLEISVINQDPTVDKKDVPRIVDHISGYVELKPESDRSFLPYDTLTVSRLARWFTENQLVPSVPKTLP